MDITMDMAAFITTLTTFFMWCTIINGSLLLFWAAISMFAQDMVYRTQNHWFAMPRETFTVVFYSLIGLFKIIFIVFNVVPYVALRLIG